MAKRIFKYELTPEPRQMIYMPVGARPIRVLAQRDIPCLFVEVDDDLEHQPVIIRTVTTGEIFEGMLGCKYVDTVFLGGDKPEEAWYTMHVYVQTEKIADSVHPRFADDRAQLREELQGGAGLVEI